MRKSHLPRRAGIALCAYLILAASGLLSAAPIVRQTSGANPAAIQATVDQFRADLGGLNNGNGGTFASGRREINWDGVPDNFAAPNNFPPTFFNVNSPRGLVVNGLEFDTGGALNQFVVSATVASGTATEFGDINATYPATFQTFSAQRLFAPRNTPALEIVFFIPGTAIPATVSGFGVVFTDVDSATGGNRSLVRVYGPDGRQLTAAAATVANNGLSFVGISFSAGERIARVVLESGNVALAATANDGVGSNDIVAMDDFIYGEPQALEYQVAPANAEAFTVTVTVPVKFTDVTFTDAPPGFVNATLRCAPHHTFRIFSSNDLQTWHPATILGAPAGPDQNRFDPRNPSLWSTGTHSAPVTLSREGQNKLFYMAKDETTGDVAFGQTP